MAGDRYETLAATFSSSLLGISIVHLHGGEVTIGSQDDDFRHAISKLADYHFVSADIHKKRLVNMGENKNAVFSCRFTFSRYNNSNEPLGFGRFGRNFEIQSF